MSASELSARLWREREVLESLLYKLHVQQSVLEHGDTRWAQHASNDVEGALARIRHSELTRAMEMESVADEWELPAESSLRDLASSAPTEAWKLVFTDHHVAMTELLGEVLAARDVNQLHLRAVLMATQEAIAGVDVTGEYSADGSQVRSEHGPRLVDRSL